ncbi:autoinducer binding domain-containing protein [Paracoccus sp. JM45]|uniref:autoinducer binding domain-containing protein n=1 Tax=Paracoccus sp. JM45 TaxID=2283626 RepID=UPI0016043856|nr:autoinducer binding domain-containing protein [Paracoccus sp. JM45]
MTSKTHGFMPLQSLTQIETALDRLSPRGYMVGYHVRFSRPVRRICTYPGDWLAAYTRQNMIVADPSVVWAVLQEGTIRWDDLAEQIGDPINVIPTAAEYGLHFGVTLSCGPASSRSMMGAARSDRNFTDAEITKMYDLLVQGHDILARSTAMRPILVEALDAIACGMTYEQACAHLGISRTALRYRLHTARNVLGAEENSEAILKAIDLGLLNSNTYSGFVKGLPFSPSSTDT